MPSAECFSIKIGKMLLWYCRSCTPWTNKQKSALKGCRCKNPIENFFPDLISKGKYIFLSYVGGRKIYFSGEMAGYYVLSPFKLTIVRNSITLNNATE